MRHLNPILLPQLASDPAVPPAGHVALYAGLDGQLRRGLPDGRREPVTGRQTTRLTTEVLIPQGQPAAHIPGLELHLQPGLHQVQAWLRLSAHQARRVVHALSLQGPAAGLVWADTWLVYPGTNLYEYARDGYGTLTYDTGYWVYNDRLIMMRMDALVDVTAAGPIGFVPTVERDRWAFDMAAGPWPWNSEGGELEWVETPAHSEPGAARLVPAGSESAVLMSYADTFSGGAYRFSAWLRSETGWAGTGLHITWLEGGNVVGEAEQITAIPAGAWTQYVIDGQAPENADTAVLRIGMWGTPPATADLLVDDVVLEQTTGQLRVWAGSLISSTPL